MKDTENRSSVSSVSTWKLIFWYDGGVLVPKICGEDGNLTKHDQKKRTFSHVARTRSEKSSLMCKEFLNSCGIPVGMADALHRSSHALCCSISSQQKPCGGASCLLLCLSLLLLLRKLWLEGTVASKHLLLSLLSLLWPDCFVFLDRNATDILLFWHPADNTPKLCEWVIVPLKSCVLKVKWCYLWWITRGNALIFPGKRDGWGRVWENEFLGAPAIKSLAAAPIARLRADFTEHT